MGLDSRYVLAPSLQEYFVDKDNGLPLSDGTVYFWKDQARTVPKPVFEISGTPPNYSYTQLPNPVTLSSVGTFEDGSGNDILPYYFPFDANGDIELYYIEVFSSGGVLQFTREGWPNFTEENVSVDQDVTNFVPNGQFLIHNDASTTPLSGTQVKSVFAYGGTVGTLDVYQIAPGGWTFERNHNSTAVDKVTFPPYSSVTIPTGNPKFACQIQTTSAGSDTTKDLCLKFRGVNTFASDSQSYNLYFEANSVGGSIANVQIIVRKYFGSGGSATTETVISSITLNTSSTPYNTLILFGTNENKTVGSGGDDFVQVIIRLPPTGTQTGVFTDFAITLNDEVLTSFPTQTEAQQIDASLGGWTTLPNPNGVNLYLPLRLTPSGLGFDDTQIAKIYASLVATPGIGELLCDGSTYQTSAYSTDGIPYSRLQAKLFNGTVPLYGTGINFVTGIISSGATQNFIYSTNNVGSSTAPVEGSIPTGFTFRNMHSPSSTGYGVKAYQYATNKIYVISTINGSVTAPTAGNSTFTVTDLRNTAAVTTSHIFEIDTVAASAMTAGHYFTFTALNPGSTDYYMWFKIDGAGADPAPGGTGIEVDILSSMSAQDVAIAVLSGLNGGRQSIITAIAASAMTAGSWFTFGTPNASNYYVWYKKDGVGADPAPANMTGIQVNVVTADTNSVVASKTIVALNQVYFGLPNFQGMFLRGVDPSSTWDFDSASRFGFVPGIYGDAIGSFEIDQFLSHIHTASSSGTVTFPRGQNYTAPLSSNVLTNDVQSGTISANLSVSTTIAATGGTETRPVNAYVYWIIKY